ncbi:hypothetical protein JHK85_018156 [Glycine max]|nr:hypothetical protein JHK85_018156 [Glycine max]
MTTRDLFYISTVSLLLAPYPKRQASKPPLHQCPDQIYSTVQAINQHSKK